MTESRMGITVRQKGGYQAYIPKPLPPDHRTGNRIVIIFVPFFSSLTLAEAQAPISINSINGIHGLFILVFPPYFTFLTFPSLKSTAKIYDAWVNAASSSLSGIDSAPMN